MRYSSIAQPRFHALAEPSFTESELTGLTFPLVLKPVDGGGGLGVFLVTSIEELRMALAELAGISNYDGGAFTGFILEEFLPGTEFSVQGIVHAGKCDILTQCQKFVTIEPSKDYPYLRGFKEVGHMAVSGQQADPAIRNLAQQCIERLAYDRGPFHMDMVLANERYYLLELGFRLSGSGLARLVQQVSGRDWAAETFAAHLDAASIPFYKLTTPASSLCIGQITAVSLNEINTAYLLQAEGYQVEVQIFTGAPSQFAASLQADLKRHGNLLGRVIVSGNSLEEVEYLLHRCAPNRTFSKNVLERHEEERINSI